MRIVTSILSPSNPSSIPNPPTSLGCLTKAAEMERNKYTYPTFQEDAEYQRDNDSQNYPSATLSQLGTSREQSKRSSNTIFKTSLS